MTRLKSGPRRTVPLNRPDSGPGDSTCDGPRKDPKNRCGRGRPFRSLWILEAEGSGRMAKSNPGSLFIASWFLVRSLGSIPLLLETPDPDSIASEPRICRSSSPMENLRPVRCSENEEIGLYLWRKRQEMVESNGLSENLDQTLSKAYRSICDAKTPIKTLKDLSQIKWVLLLSFFDYENMFFLIKSWSVQWSNLLGAWESGFWGSCKDFSKNLSPMCLPRRTRPTQRVTIDLNFLLFAFSWALPSTWLHSLFNKTNCCLFIGKKAKEPKRYVPKKNSVAYALLITLYRLMSWSNAIGLWLLLNSFVEWHFYFSSGQWPMGVVIWKSRNWLMLQKQVGFHELQLREWLFSHFNYL